LPRPASPVPRTDGAGDMKSSGQDAWWRKHRLQAQLDGLLAAWRFLTVVPLPGSRGTLPGDLAASLPYFPLVGLTVGLLLAVAAGPLLLVCPTPLAAVLFTALLAALSGALHLDGLADTADGFASARGREQVLAIMRDSRIGAMGVVALVLVLAFKAAALASLSAERLPAALLLAPLAGRTAILIHLALLPYVRASGLASIFLAGPRRSAAGMGLVLLGLTALLAGWAALTALIAWGLALVLFGLVCRRRIGGITGDTLGAVCELAETAVLCGMALEP